MVTNIAKIALNKIEFNCFKGVVNGNREIKESYQVGGWS